MHRDRRLAAIVEMVGENGSVDVGRLAETLGVSSATVRRDLTELAQQGMVRRTHGGASGAPAAYELPLRYRTARQHEEKERIAAAAAELVTEGCVVGFSGGTTTSAVARSIVGTAGLTVVTNALNIATELAIRTDIRLVVTGGVTRPTSFELVGPFAERTLTELRLDVALVGVDAIDANGVLSTHDEVEASVNRCMLRAASTRVIVADRSKFGRRAFAQIESLAAATHLVTGSDAQHPLGDVVELPAALRVIEV